MNLKERIDYFLELNTRDKKRWSPRFLQAVETIVKLQEENEKLKASLEWQPIETAPRDGTIIIVKGGIAHWYNEAWRTLAGVEYPGHSIQWEVEYWMPLPKKPITEIINKEKNDK